MSTPEEVAMADFRLAVEECGRAIETLRLKLDEISDAEMVRYKGFLQEALVGLVNLHGTAVEMQKQGLVVADTELGEVSFTFIQYLNTRRAGMLVLAPEQMARDTETNKCEQSIGRLAKTLRDDFQLYWPEFWP